MADHDVDPMSEETAAAKGGAMALIMFSMLPGMMVAGFFPEWGSVLGLAEWLGVGAVGGALGGAAFVDGKGPRHVGVVSGAVLCVVVPLALHLYVNLWDDRQTFSKLELAVVWMLSALPCVGLYQAWLERARRSEVIPEAKLLPPR